MGLPPEAVTQPVPKLFWAIWSGDSSLVLMVTGPKGHWSERSTVVTSGDLKGNYYMEITSG